MKTLTADIYRFSLPSKIALTLTSAFATAGFTWPFFAPDMASARFAQYFFWIAMPLAFVLLLAQLSDRSLDAKSVALLGMLAALLAALRPLGAGAVGLEPMWFYLSWRRAFSEAPLAFFLAHLECWHLHSLPVA